MQTSIKLLVSSAVLLAASSAAFGQSSANERLGESSPTFDRPTGDSTEGACQISGQNYSLGVPYAAYSADFQDAVLSISLTSSPQDSFLALYRGSFDPKMPCANFVAANDDVSPDLDSAINGAFPAGTYTIVVTAYGNNRDPEEPFEYGAYRLTTNASSLRRLTPFISTPNPVPVPVAGIPALALGSLGLIGAAGFLSRRRKAKADKA